VFVNMCFSKCFDVYLDIRCYFESIKYMNEFPIILIDDRV